jgi:CCR4-NOT transcription complex subunit 7/8
MAIEDVGPLIQEVWEGNLEKEMRLIRNLVDEYPYVSMDTEFPGVVARPIGSFKNSSDYHYQTLRCNVDLLKIIQLGLTFTNEMGVVRAPNPSLQTANTPGSSTLNSIWATICTPRTQ